MIGVKLAQELNETTAKYFSVLKKCIEDGILSRDMPASELETNESFKKALRDAGLQSVKHKIGVIS